MVQNWKGPFKKMFFNFSDEPLLGSLYFSWHGSLAWKSRKNDVRLIEHRFCITPILFTIHAKIIYPRWGCMADKNILQINKYGPEWLETHFYQTCHGRTEDSRNKTTIMVLANRSSIFDGR